MILWLALFGIKTWKKSMQSLLSAIAKQQKNVVNEQKKEKRIWRKRIDWPQKMKDIAKK